MGLLEKRKMKELQEATLPSREKEIAEICGAAIPYEVDWESFADDAEGLKFLDNGACHRLNMALRMLCQDEFGKEAVREGLKRVRVRNVRDGAERKVGFAGGVLEIQGAYGLGSSGFVTDSEIRRALEQGL